MYWSLFLFRGHSARALASIVYDREQGGVFYSEADKGNSVSRSLKNEGEWTWMAVISSRKKSQAVGETFMSKF